LGTPEGLSREKLYELLKWAVSVTFLLYVPLTVQQH